MQQKWQRIILNVRGFKYDVLLNVFGKYPNSRLGKLKRYVEDNDLDKLESICDSFNFDQREFYFNKDPFILNFILNLYTEDEENDGLFHVNEGICYNYLSSQLKYWQIDFDLVKKCCRIHIDEKQKIINSELDKENEILKLINFKHDFGVRFFPELRQRAFNCLEYPTKTVLGRLYLITTSFFVTLSALIIVLETIPDFDADLDAQQIFFYAQIFCTVWFSLETLTRIVAYPSIKLYFISLLNILEFISTFTFIIYIALYDVPNFATITNVTRSIRILSFLRIAKHTTTFVVLADTVYHSRKEILSYFFYLLLGVLIFSSITYSIEYDSPKSKFYSMPAAFWWAIVTLTTVGYGDAIPQTIAGKIFGGVCCVCGVLLVTMPIGLISNKYSGIYEFHQKKKQIEIKKKAQKTAEQKI